MAPVGPAAQGSFAADQCHAHSCVVCYATHEVPQEQLEPVASDKTLFISSFPWEGVFTLSHAWGVHQLEPMNLLTHGPEHRGKGKISSTLPPHWF